MDTSALFIQLAVVLGLAAAVGYIAKQLKLPLVVAYLIAGVLLSLLKWFDPSTSLALTFFPEIGIAFVLFLVGMELNIKETRYLGKAVIIASSLQILISLAAGYLIATALGFPFLESFYLGAGLAFSSTVVVVKLLLEKKDLNSLYGKLSVGILLIEDLVAILLLMGMTLGGTFTGISLENTWPILFLVVKGILLLTIALGLSRYALERVFFSAAGSSELLFLSAVAWCFIFVALSLFFGFSVVIGAFLAGIALANSPFHYEIQGKVKPLRDFFVTLFFVYLGTQVSFSHLGDVIPLIVLFTLYALVFKPLIFLLVLGAMGFKRHTIFQTALNLSQVSEFSLIVMVVGLELGVVSQNALTAMALTGVITIIVSSIMISSSRWFYKRMNPWVDFFVHSTFVHQIEEATNDTVLEDHVILIGAHRTGSEIIKFLKKAGVPFLVLDFNPLVVKRLIGERIHTFYGDLGDPEILEFLNLEDAKLIISTAADLDDNLLLLSEVERRKAKAAIIVRAASNGEAERLYMAGADYVILPEVVSGDFVAQILKNHWPSMSYFKDRAQIELDKLSRNHLAFE